MVYENGEWTASESPITTDGLHPALNTVANVPYIAWTECNEPPYRIQGEELLGAGESVFRPPHSRRLTFNLKNALSGSQTLTMNADITLEISDPLFISSTGNEKLKFQYYDSLLTPSRSFAFVPMKITNENERLRIPVNIHVQNFSRSNTSGSKSPSLSFFQIGLKKPGTSSLLTTINSYSTSQFVGVFPQNFIWSDTFEVDLKAFIGQQIQLEGLTFFSKDTSDIAIAEIYDLRRGKRMNTELTSLETNSVTPLSFNLYQNFPNPFNPTTTLTFNLPKPSDVNLIIYDITGRKIRNLISSAYPAGSHQIQWDGKDYSGNSVASGIYIYRIDTNNYTQSRKMMLLK